MIAVTRARVRTRRQPAPRNRDREFARLRERGLPARAAALRTCLELVEEPERHAVEAVLELSAGGFVRLELGAEAQPLRGVVADARAAADRERSAGGDGIGGRNASASAWIGDEYALLLRRRVDPAH